MKLSAHGQMIEGRDGIAKVGELSASRQQPNAAARSARGSEVAKRIAPSSGLPSHLAGVAARTALAIASLNLPIRLAHAASLAATLGFITYGIDCSLKYTSIGKLQPSLRILVSSTLSLLPVWQVVTYFVLPMSLIQVAVLTVAQASLSFLLSQGGREEVMWQAAWQAWGARVALWLLPLPLAPWQAAAFGASHLLVSRSLALLARCSLKPSSSYDRVEWVLQLLKTIAAGLISYRAFSLLGVDWSLLQAGGLCFLQALLPLIILRSFNTLFGLVQKIYASIVHARAHGKPALDGLTQSLTLRGFA